MRVDIPGKGPINIEGQELPLAAKHFEMLPFFKELPDEVRKWILDLKYAWARERTAPSSVIVRSLEEIEGRILSEREKVTEHLRMVAPETDANALYGDWLLAILTIREKAEKAGTCTWFIEPQTGEVAYYVGVVSRIYRSMLSTQNAQRSASEQIPIPEVLETIASKAENEQIAFINSVVDGLSDKSIV